MLLPPPFPRPLVSLLVRPTRILSPASPRPSQTGHRRLVSPVRAAHSPEPVAATTTEAGTRGAGRVISVAEHRNGLVAAIG